MKDKSLYQINVTSKLKELKKQANLEEPKEFEMKVYRQFEHTKQEPVKMAAALWILFEAKSLGKSKSAEVERYLRLRIRNAVETLIEEDDPVRIAEIEKKGWFGRTELEVFLKAARERQKLQAMIYLMQLKDQKYGYIRDEFLL